MIIKNYKSIYPVGFIINSLKAAIKWIKVSNERIDVKTAPPPPKKNNDQFQLLFINLSKFRT